MAKYDFNSSRYAKFFASPENNKFLQTFLDNKDIFFCNYGWYKTQGRVDPNVTPTDAEGVASFTIKSRKLEAAPLMDLRAPLGDSETENKEGLAFYTASIPDFITRGTVETAAERDYKVKQFEIFGNDADIVAAWADKVQEKINSVDATMNFMTAQLETTASIDYRNIGKGIQAPLHKVEQLPAANQIDISGNNTKKWSANTKLISWMKDEEKKYRDRLAYGGALVWKMTRNEFNTVVLENAEVKELVKNYRFLHKLAYTDGMPVTVEDFNLAIIEFGGVSKIELVQEQERNSTYTSDQFVHGWADNKVVLRPAGDAVIFKHTNILDERMIKNYGANGIVSVFGRTNDGLGLLLNQTMDNGKFKEWHTDLMCSACPALLDFYYHVIYKVDADA
jgi:hypothetical protein